MSGYQPWTPPDPNIRFAKYVLIAVGIVLLISFYNCSYIFRQQQLQERKSLAFSIVNDAGYTNVQLIEAYTSFAWRWGTPCSAKTDNLMYEFKADNKEERPVKLAVCCGASMIYEAKGCTLRRME